jgi:hypothetical protein
MSIVKALNDLSGKNAKTIEKAIRNIDLGGGGGGSGGMLVTFTLEINPDAQTERDYYIVTADKTFSEISSAYDDGQLIEGVLDLTSVYQSKYMIPMELTSVSSADLQFNNLTPNGSDSKLSRLTNYRVVMANTGDIVFEQLSGDFAEETESEFFPVDFIKSGSTISCSVTSEEVYNAAHSGKKIYATLNGTPLTRIEYTFSPNHYVHYIGVVSMASSSRPITLESITGMNYIIIYLEGSTVTYVEKTVSFNS